MKKQLILLFFCVAFLAADTGAVFEKNEIWAPGSGSALYVGDLTDDELPDVLFLQEELDRNSILLFVSKNGVFDALPDYTIPLPQDAIFWCLGEVNAANQIREVLVVTHEAVVYFDLPTGTRHLITEYQSPFSYLRSHTPVFKNFTIDVENDGRSEILCYFPDELRVFGGGGSTFERLSTIAFPNLINIYSTNQFDANQFRIVISDVFFQDFDGDGHRDLIIACNGLTKVFIYNNGDFGNPAGQKRESNFTTNLEITNVIEEDIELETTKTGYFSNAQTRVEAVDINRDGFCDFVVAKFDSRRFFSGVGQVQVYLSKNGFLSNIPDDILITRNYTGEYVISDLNGDHLEDILVLRESISIWATLKFLAVKKTTAKYSGFLLGPTGRFELAPYSFDFNSAIDLSNLQRQASSSNFHSDFNADGLRDVLCQNSDGTYTIYWGSEKKPFENKTAVNIPIARELRCADLNLDGMSDIVTLSNTRVEAKITILYSKAPPKK